MRAAPALAAPALSAPALARVAALLCALAAALMGPLLPCPAGAVEGRPPPGAAACTGCHAAGAAMGPLAGRPEAEIVAALADYRSGARPASVMNRIAKGFTEGESRAIAAYFAQIGPER
ncbi:c-type cytochrome [Methylobacterium soli]|nr:cytochrome C [Methylobacterium soli]